MQKLHQHYNNNPQPVNEPIRGREGEMALNNAGGYTFPISCWEGLKRFLILGTEGGTFYVSESKLTVDNALSVAQCIKEDPIKTTDIIVDIATNRRAFKTDPTLFAYAMLVSNASLEGRKYAFNHFNKVVNIGTHLFHFLEYVESFRGWGNGLKKAVQQWYLDKAPEALAYQLVKYKQRDGWSHRDVLRLSHPKTTNVELNNILCYAVKGYRRENPMPRIIHAAEKAKTVEVKQLPRLITEYRLPREVIPTEHLNRLEVWEALLQDMPLTALLRNLGKLSSINALTPGSESFKLIMERLTNLELVKKSKVHPMQVLAALLTYAQGHGDKGKLTWLAQHQIVDTLNKMFYDSLSNVEPTGKRILTALDVSGSMTTRLSNYSGLSCKEGGAILATVLMATEANGAFMAFDTKPVNFPLSPKQRLDDVRAAAKRLNGGGTNLSIPMQFATDNHMEVDAIVIFTDNETWRGVHPCQQLEQYRNKVSKDAKLVVVSMVANKASIADNRDPNTLEVIGFDTNTPTLINNFIKGL